MPDLDKSKEMAVSLDLLDEKLHFEGNVKGNESISIDETSPLGNNLGYTPLELFLLSLASCFGDSIIVLLREMNKTIIGMEIIAKGIRRPVAPTGFESIIITLHIKSKDINSADLDKVIQLSRESFSPVWCMLKGNVDLEVKYNIVS